MSTKSRQTIYYGRITGAQLRAENARKRAVEATREADRAEADPWSLRMEGFGGPAQPSPTIGQCLNSGLTFLEVECNRCKTRASLPLAEIRRPRHTPIWKLEAALKCRSCPEGSLCSAGPHDQADRKAGDRAVSLGASRRRYFFAALRRGASAVLREATRKSTFEVRIVSGTCPMLRRELRLPVWGEVTLVSGMPVEAFIQTDERTVISPIC